jgi:glyoxylase I family protein
MTSVQHIALNCRDLCAQEQFFTRHFGFQRARVFNAGTPNEFIMLRLGTTCLELFQAGAVSAAHHGGEQPVGVKHLAFEVPSVEEAVRKLNADGIATDAVIDCSSIVKGMKVCFFNDRDGNRLELMEGYQDQFTGEG